MAEHFKREADSTLPLTQREQNQQNASTGKSIKSMRVPLLAWKKINLVIATDETFKFSLITFQQFVEERSLVFGAKTIWSSWI